MKFAMYDWCELIYRRAMMIFAHAHHLAGYCLQAYNHAHHHRAGATQDGPCRTHMPVTHLLGMTTSHPFCTLVDNRPSCWRGTQQPLRCSLTRPSRSWLRVAERLAEVMAKWQGSSLLGREAVAADRGADARHSADTWRGAHPQMTCQRRNRPMSTAEGNISRLQQAKHASRILMYTRPTLCSTARTEHDQTCRLEQGAT